MTRNSNTVVHGVDPIAECFLSMDLHKAQVKNTVVQDLVIVFSGIKEYF